MLRDITSRKQSEEELRNAKRETLRAASAKAEFLAKVSHEIRTPLNAMTGFAEVIMAERFGPIGNERYREYIKDIHAAGTHLVSMLNDLLDLSRIETGQIELAFVNVNLNALTQQCVGIMQPQANRARIIIRTSLTPGLPLVRCRRALAAPDRPQSDRRIRSSSPVPAARSSYRPSSPTAARRYCACATPAPA